ncbi:MAG: CotH kinase family protein, partial [Bacteroidales bacterium]|nr:CotH kinase family protein [Bacteroidales bacterium]
MNRYLHFSTKYLIALFCFIFPPVDGQLRINEFLALNTTFNVDPDFQTYSDWVEIYNSSDSIVDLSGYSLTDDLSNPARWTIPQGVNIPADSYLIIWMDDKNTGLHAPFKLTGSGEQIGLYNRDGKVVDTISYGQQYSDISYGRTILDNTWHFFVLPTPGGPNTSSYYTGISPQPAFSTPGGFYNGTITLGITNPEGNGNIRYTIDGSEPDSNSQEYINQLTISETSLIRARIIETDKMPGNTISNTFFIDEPDHDLPVLSLSTNPSNLWDPLTGIYVNYMEEWERPCGLEYFNAAGNQEFSLNAGIKIFGGTSRARAQKSFSIHTRNLYGDGPVNYPLLPNRKDIDLYKSFILRNSANDWSGGWRGTLFRDALIHTVIENQMDVDYQSYQPAVIYLNGEYWGILNIRDKHNEDYCEVHYGVDRDSIDIIKHNEAVVGDDVLYNEMMDFMEDNNFSGDELYHQAESMIDIEEFINYMIAEIYSCNIDWPGNNYRLWRPKTEHGKWRWMLFDTEFGFNGFEWAPVSTNMLVNKALDPDMDDYVNKDLKAPWATRVFIKLTQNQEFVNQFVSRYLSHLYTTYEPERVVGIVDSLKSNLENEMPGHIARWGSEGGIFSMTEWENYIEGMKDFAWQRPPYALNHLLETFGIDDADKVNLSLDIEEGGHIVLNGIVLEKNTFTGEYYPGLPVELDIKPSPGYVFKEWQLTGLANQKLTLIPAAGEWKYLDDGSDQGTQWTDPDFDDSGWKTGTAKFGYGDGDEQTLISYGTDAENKYITYYFRSEFNIEDKDSLVNLYLNLLRDDGAVAYLNGIEAIRSNMSVREINYQSVSLTPVSDSDEAEFYKFNLDTSLLADGRNVLAVEIHQSSANSTDLGFDLELTGNTTSQVNQVVIDTPRTEIIIGGDLQIHAIMEKADETISLKINEVMASNLTGLTDEFGNPDDWIEIINTGQ